jgi:hypothetical protein
MSHQGTSGSRSKAGYTKLNEQEDKDPSNSSPIFPILERDDFGDEATLKPTTFQADGLETFYKPIEGYEGAHRYDPDYMWSVVDEGRVVRKVCLPSLDSLRWIPTDTRLD